MTIYVFYNKIYSYISDLNCATTNNINFIYINNNPHNKTTGQIAAHELYGYSLFWLFNIPNSHSGNNSIEINNRVKEAENNAK